MPRKNIPVAVPPGSKWCHSCAEAKPRQMFGVDRRNADGLRFCCLRCENEKQRERHGRMAAFSMLGAERRMRERWC